MVGGKSLKPAFSRVGKKMTGKYLLLPGLLLGLLIVMVWGKKSHIVIEGLLGYGFILVCVYLGRWLMRYGMLRDWKRALLGGMLSMAGLSLLGALLWERVFTNDAYFHSETLTISTPFVALLMAGGAVAYLIGRVWKDRAAARRGEQADGGGQLHTYARNVNINNEYVFVKNGGKVYKLEFKYMLFAEASRNSTKVILTNQRFNLPMSFSSFEGLLPVNQFIRVHRSFIVSKSKIGHIEGNRVFMGEKEIPIGDNYREEFFRKIGIDQK
jgi:hypothetical protein